MKTASSSHHQIDKPPLAAPLLARGEVPACSPARSVTSKSVTSWSAKSWSAKPRVGAVDVSASVALPACAADFNRDVVCLLGVAFDRMTLADAKAKVLSAIHQRRRCHIATPNANLMRMARANAEFRAAVLASDLTLVDGMPLVWMARLLRLGITTRAAGSDLFDALACEPGRTIRTFFFGGTERVCTEIKHKLGQRLAGVHCVGALAPGFGSVNEMSAPANIAAINDARPDLVVVAVGARKGIGWIASNEAALTAPVLANLGATIHFAAGTVRRAPDTWQRMGLEWLWRIRQEPELWRRYAADFADLSRSLVVNIGPAIVLRLCQGVYPPATQRVQILTSDNGSGKTLKLEGVFRQDDLGMLREALRAGTRIPAPIVIDISGVRDLDSAALGLLLLAYGHQFRTKQPISVTGAGWRMRLVLRVNGCGFLIGTPPQSTLTVLKTDQQPGYVGAAAARSLPR